MLQLTLPETPEQELFDNVNGVFITIPGHKAVTLQLEHSLISLSRWESKWKKPFLSNKDPLTQEELIDYIRCMSLNQSVDPEIYRYLDNDDIRKIQEYIEDSHTATTIYDRRTMPRHSETITSELIYYWMISCEIPHEYEKWHLNRLLTLIRICNIKQSPDRKMSRQSIYRQNQELNALRRARMGSKG